VLFLILLFVVLMIDVYITGVSCPPYTAACLITSDDASHWCVCLHNRMSISI